MSDEIRKIALEFFKDKFKSMYKKQKELATKIDSLENHDIFKIWTSIRKGGKTTLEALLNNNKGIKELKEQIAELIQIANAQVVINNHYQKEINELKELSERNRKRVDELKEFRHHIAMPRIINLEEVLRDFYKHKLEKADYTIECLSSKEHVADKMVDYVKNDIIFYKGRLEKLDSKVGSARQTVKQCADCRKYKTEDCPPWPTKGPNHWCTQFEPKKSGGDGFKCGNCGKWFTVYHDGDGLNTGFCPECSTLQDTVGLDEKLPEPIERRDCLFWTPNHKCSYFQNEFLNIGKLNCNICTVYKPIEKTEPEKEYILLETYNLDMKALEELLIEEFITRLEMMTDEDDIYKLREEYEGRLKK